MKKINVILDEGETYDIDTRKGRKGYTGYFGVRGKLKSTKITRKKKSQARHDALVAIMDALFGSNNDRQKPIRMT